MLLRQVWDEKTSARMVNEVRTLALCVLPQCVRLPLFALVLLHLALSVPPDLELALIDHGLVCRSCAVPTL